MQAVALHQQGQLASARALYERLLKKHPANFDALHLSGVVALQTGKLHRAVELIGHAIAVDQRQAAAHVNLGLALAELKQAAAALRSFERAIALAPGYAEAHNGRGNSLQALGDFAAAIESHQRALALKPDFVDACNDLGKAQSALAEHAAALASFTRAIALRADFAEAHANRGAVLNTLGRSDEALDEFERAIALKPGYAPAHYNRGLTLHDRGQFDAAIASYECALKLRPDFAEAFYNRGNSLQELKRHAAAIDSYERSLSIDPGSAKACYNLGVAWQNLNQFAAALGSYERAIALAPGMVDAWSNRGLALKELGQHAAAIGSFAEALRLDPDAPFVDGLHLHAQMQICDWRGVEDGFARLARRIASGEKASPPFAFFAMCDDPALQRRASEIWMQEKHPGASALPAIERWPAHERIRVGYFSADFRNHAVALVIAGVFEEHDRSRFEVIAFSFGPDVRDTMRTRLESAFDRFIDVRELSDHAVARLAREMEIDIAVDLVGFTRLGRPGIFSERAAPVQANYLGYPGTLGAASIDYLIADAILIPEGSERHYTESIVRLPDSYQSNDSSRQIAARQFTREEAGLPHQGFVFCCFNNNYKILPATFASWMRILARVDGSVLWLLADNPDAAANLRQHAVAHGIAAERLIFAARMEQAEHLARHRLADLFLDTLPCNAHVTTSDALWAGLPVLTCPGEAFASRVAASLLSAIRIPELIVSTPTEYEALAVELASNATKLAAIRDRLAANRLTTPLFDTRRFTRQLEAAFAEMHRRHQLGLLPADIGVADAE